MARTGRGGGWRKTVAHKRSRPAEQEVSESEASESSKKESIDWDELSPEDLSTKKGKEQATSKGKRKAAYLWKEQNGRNRNTGTHL